MKKTLITLVVLLFSIFFGFGQKTQVLRGRVVDKEAGFSLIGVNVVIVSYTTKEGLQVGASTDADGYFRFAAIPFGRHTIKVSYLGYKDVVLNNIVVDAGREAVLQVKLEESITKLKTVEVRAKRSGEVNNEMATISAREFSVEEADRYAGSRGEPARMASNFAGVQGADDSRNDIVIRGNSPSGVLWRIEGLNIPNPNHFAIAGTSGGPVSIISNKILANSDFYTGAFPAEFGNTISGVFDLKMRNGNSEKVQFYGQFGFLGTEGLIEGPINKEKRSSFLLTYRYANLGLFKKLGIDIGTQAEPNYQDFSARFNFPIKNGNLSLFAIAGNSSADILISEQEVIDRNIFGQNDRDQYFKTATVIAGFSYLKSLNKKTLLKNTLGFTFNRQDAYHELINFKRDSLGNQQTKDNKFLFDSLSPILDYVFSEPRVSNHFSIKKKLRAGSALKIGAVADLFFFSFNDSARTSKLVNNVNQFTPWRTRWKTQNDLGYMLQPYISWKKQVTERLTLTSGLSFSLFGNDEGTTSGLEPRLGAKYELNAGQKLSLGLGIHSQMQPTYTYFYGPTSDANGVLNTVNKGMGFTRSAHIVLGYDKLVGENMRLKAEAYYQHLYNIPVSVTPNSFSMVNTGSGFSRFFPDSLKNDGTGKNYGLELTLEQFFANDFYFLLTGSLFEAKYTGSDGVERDTEFNGNYSFNALVAREFVFKNKSSLNIGAKLTSIGGRRYGPVDSIASEAALEIIYLDDGRNSKQFKDYFRVDLKIDYKINTNKFTHTIAVDLVNFLGIENILTLSYAPQKDGSFIKEEYQLGFLPVFFYRIEF